MLFRSGVDPLQRFSPRVLGSVRFRAGAPASMRLLSAPLDLLSGPSWSPGLALRSSPLRVISRCATPTAFRVWAGHRHVCPADFSAVDLLGLLITALSSCSSSLPSRVGRGVMLALEVRPVALRPVIAGIRRRDHLGLRRVFRDGVGSEFAVVAPDLPSRRWAHLLPLRVVASDSALRAVLAAGPVPDASPHGSGAVRLDFLSWGCQRSSCAPLGSALRRPGPLPIRPVGSGSRP